MDAPAAGFMLLTIGAVSIVAAIVGDGAKLPGNVEFPPLKSKVLRILLGVVGAGFLFLGAGYVSPQGEGLEPGVENIKTASPSSVPETKATPTRPTEIPLETETSNDSQMVDYVEEIDAICLNRVPQLNDVYDSVEPATGHRLLADRLAILRDELRSLAPPGKDARLLDRLVELVASMSNAAHGMSLGVSYDSSVYSSHQAQFSSAKDHFRRLVSHESLPACQKF